MAIFGVLCFAAFAIVGGTIFRGYALTVLWQWFVFPAFGAPPLSIALAIGLAIIVSMLTATGKSPEYEGTPTERMLKATGVVFAVPAFALGIGWIVHQFA